MSEQHPWWEHPQDGSEPYCPTCEQLGRMLKRRNGEIEQLRAAIHTCLKEPNAIKARAIIERALGTDDD